MLKCTFVRRSHPTIIGYLIDRATTPTDRATSGHVENITGVLDLSKTSLLEIITPFGLMIGPHALLSESPLPTVRKFTKLAYYTNHISLSLLSTS